jgi:hypothetical protein
MGTGTGTDMGTGADLTTGLEEEKEEENIED